ncbi:MAG: HEPN domain-containing protein [Solirubrobacteraceae bacterium]
MAGPVDIAEMLLGAAADDEFMARSLLPIKGVTDAGLGFHTQQAVEKSLKSVLALRKIEFPYSHDLDGLVRLCQKNDIEVPKDLAGVDDLSPFAARLRYGMAPSTHLDRDQAMRWAASAVQWARKQIEPNEHADDTPASSIGATAPEEPSAFSPEG